MDPLARHGVAVPGRADGRAPAFEDDVTVVIVGRDLDRRDVVAVPPGGATG